MASTGKDWWSVFFKDNNRLLLNFLTRRLGNEADAADVAQITFMKLWGVEDPAAIVNPRSFMFRVAANSATDFMRQRTRRDLHANELYQYQDTSRSRPALAFDREAEEELEAKQRLEVIYQALQELSPKCRKAFISHRFSRKTYREIAHDLGVSQNMVERYIIDAMVHIRRHLNRKT